MVRIILTGYTDVTALVEAINCGQVYKYVTKPWDNDELRLTVGRALEHYEPTSRVTSSSSPTSGFYSRLQEMTRGFVRAIADALEAKDDYVLRARAAGQRLRRGHRSPDGTGRRDSSNNSRSPPSCTTSARSARPITFS